MAIGDLFVLFFAGQPIFILWAGDVMQIAANRVHSRAGEPISRVEYSA